jgi:hypothetical protein
MTPSDEKGRPMIPNLADAFTNPVRYWSDVILFQTEMSRQVYEVACMVNPFLPKIDFSVGMASYTPAPLRPDPRREARVPSTRALPPKALPERTVIAKPVPLRAEATTRKTSITLAPGLPPSTQIDEA